MLRNYFFFIADVETFVVALGESLDLTKIAILASAPDNKHIFPLKDTNSTAITMKRIINRVRRYNARSRS